MPSLTSFFHSIKEGMAVRAAVPLLGLKEKERLHCFYGKGEPPAFTLTFPDGVLALEQVDTARPCRVMFDCINQTIAVAASIQAIRDPSTLELVARETVTHTHARNYFRVDASTKVAASPVVPEETPRETGHWRLLGDTIDLSGSGLLCSFGESLEKELRVKIELTLPTRDMEVIVALGHVVRCRKIEAHLYHIALHFDEIDSESQDKIMACCFELQRRYLRMRVRLESIDAA
ncbi:PilZ domain-containing protein [Desulfobulbus elongatus]|uniref:PilZ domain-containing protein n=1 Tax=Desulfobulbus elongatus TaxID=53332 RepID=UPI0012FCA2F9|nr:PilZ domain-containing protein [Desulfobulbus elongatus]